MATQWVVDMQNKQREFCDCLPEFYATESEAIAAGCEELQRNAQDRARGLEDECSGWAYGFTLRECAPFDPY